ncbi:7tm 6 domain containing protein, partial [Asbolus verrucosus]
MSVIEESFGINLRVMKACCLYPPLTHGRWYKIKAYLMHLCFVMPVPTLGILYLLLKEDLDMERVNYNAGFLAQTTCFTTKLLPFIKEGHRIRKCIDYFNSSSFAVLNEKQKKIMDQCVKVCRRNTFIFLICVGGGVTSWATKPFFWEGVYFASVATGVIDPLIAGLAYHATSQIKILKDNLQHLSKYTEEGMSKRNNMSPSQRASIKAMIMYGKIRQSINHHNAILEFVKEYEDCFSSVVFSQFAASVFSNSLTNAIYMGQWYDYDVKSKRALITLMERSKVPITVTSGKILDLSLTTFTT